MNINIKELLDSIDFTRYDNEYLTSVILDLKNIIPMIKRVPIEMAFCGHRFVLDDVNEIETISSYIKAVVHGKEKEQTY